MNLVLMDGPTFIVSLNSVQVTFSLRSSSCKAGPEPINSNIWNTSSGKSTSSTKLSGNPECIVQTSHLQY